MQYRPVRSHLAEIDRCYFTRVDGWGPICFIVNNLYRFIGYTEPIDLTGNDVIANAPDNGHFGAGSGAKQSGKVRLAKNRQNLRRQRILFGLIKTMDPARQKPPRRSAPGLRGHFR